MAENLTTNDPSEPGLESDSRPVALITGGATGVGRACAVRFAELNYDVVLNFSRSEADALATREAILSVGVRCVLCRADVSVESQVMAMMAQIDQQFGRLDVLVNNAAVTHFVPAGDLQGMTEEMWDRILAVNTKGPFFCSKAAAPLLRSGDGGAIVNVSSVAGQTGAGSCIAYSASKGALNTLTKSMARALAPEIRVNAVLPGPIDSRWIREGDNDWDLAAMTADFPIPRASSPDEIAEGVLFLAVGTSMTTGQLLAIDGGQTL